MDMLIVVMAAVPAAIPTLHAIRNQNVGDTHARMHETHSTASPERNILFLPTISPDLAIGTMKITLARRNAVFTYARSWDPTSKSSPMLTRERFIMVLSSGVMKLAMLHAISTVLISALVYSVELTVRPSHWEYLSVSGIGYSYMTIPIKNYYK